MKVTHQRNFDLTAWQDLMCAALFPFPSVRAAAQQTDSGIEPATIR
jgi:hypothetical protein